MHVVAVVHGADRLALDESERVDEALRVAPGGEARVLAERALGDPLVRPHGALRLDRGDGGEADAREEDDEGPAEAGHAWKRGMRGAQGTAPS